MQLKTSGFYNILLGPIIAVLMLTSCAVVEQRPSPARATPRHKPLPSVQFVIQVGAFSDMDNAVRLTEGLQQNGLNAYHFIDASALYKVRFGNYRTRQEATAAAEALRSNGLIEVYYIVSPPQITTTHDLRNQIVGTARKYIGVPYKVSIAAV